MSKVEQIYTLVNNVAKQVLGSTTITAVDTSTLVSLGETLTQNNSLDSFYSVLADRIGKTIIKSAVYESDDRGITKNNMEFGAILQKITVELETDTAVHNQSYNTTARNPYDISRKSTITQKMFRKLSTWSKEYIIPTYQIQTAFTNAESMGSMVNGIYNSIISMIEIEKEALGNLAVCTAIAQNVSTTTSPIYRKLKTEYNTLTGQKKTATELLLDKEFLRWANREIKLVVDNVKKPSTIYNKGGKVRWVKDNDMAVELLSQFASASATYLESDTFHKELVALKNFKSIPYWQGSGTSFAYADCSKILLKEGEENIEITDVIANIRSTDSVSVLFDKTRINSIYNQRTDEVIYIPKMERSYMVDTNEVNVVFTLQ